MGLKGVVKRGVWEAKTGSFNGVQKQCGLDEVTVGIAARPISADATQPLLLCVCFPPLFLLDFNLPSGLLFLSAFFRFRLRA